MTNRETPKQAADLGALEFEITDFAEARRALDELPAGLERMQQTSPGYWEAKRRPPSPADRALTGPTMDWVVTLPAALRPHTTCAQFPRVINTIAEAWPDEPRCTRVLDHMVNDHRGGRRGFPASVQAELVALMRHKESHAPR